MPLVTGSTVRDLTVLFTRDEVIEALTEYFEIDLPDDVEAEDNVELEARKDWGTAWINVQESTDPGGAGEVRLRIKDVTIL